MSLPEASKSWPGWRVLAAVAASYLACVSVATFPVVLGFNHAIPGQLTDPLEHLWIIRWSEACLLEGRSPFFCPSLNFPTGVPLGYFPPMHFQTAAYLTMGLVTSNDVARFNVLWFFGFLGTGLGTFLLAWWTVRNAWAAWLAGLGAMLSGPMLMHAHGHLETMQVGAVPLFLICWLRFVDRPGAGRLMAAVGLYWLMVASAPYFAVLAIFPAGWAVVWLFGVCGPENRKDCITSRAAWLAGFGLIALPGLAILFSSQIWASTHGYSMARTRSEFNRLGAPPWSSFIPSPLHRLGSAGFFEWTGYTSRMSECSSYLGIVTLVLLAYAAIFRIKFARRGFWWSVLILMVVLSWGAEFVVGSTRISLPAGWIYGIFPPFHLIRVPARFNLFASVCAAVPVSAALGDLLSKLTCPKRRASVAITIGLLMLADLAMIPFESSVIPPIPPFYRELMAKNPQTTLVDAPMFGSNEGQVYSSLWGYWQSIHRARTTAGYPGVPNVAFEAEIVRPSPFHAARLLDNAYLADPKSERLGAVQGVNARDYAWLYLHVHGFDHIVWHQGKWFDPKYAEGSARVKALLAEAIVTEDADVAVFERDRMHPPERLTWLCAEGFRPALSKAEPWSFGVLREGRMVVFIADPNRSMNIRFVGLSAFGHRRDVRLVEGARELARWSVEPGMGRTIETPSLTLSSGIHELRLMSDSDDRPSRYSERLDDARTAYSLRLNSVQVAISAPSSR
jgi:hypothetical protein